MNRRNHFLSTLLMTSILLFTLAACDQTNNNKIDMSNNPFAEASTLPFEAPDFDAIENEHFIPAFREGMRIQLEEMEQIASNPEAPTNENTIVEMEKSGHLLSRTQRVLFNITSAHTKPELQILQSEMASEFAAHSDNILLNQELFQRVETLYNSRDGLNLDPASAKLLEDTYRSFIRAGARLTDAEQQRMREINERVSELTTRLDRKSVV